MLSDCLSQRRMLVATKCYCYSNAWWLVLPVGGAGGLSQRGMLGRSGMLFNIELSVFHLYMYIPRSVGGLEVVGACGTNGAVSSSRRAELGVVGMGEGVLHVLLMFCILCLN